MTLSFFCFVFCLCVLLIGSLIDSLFVLFVLFVCLCFYVLCLFAGLIPCLFVCLTDSLFVCWFCVFVCLIGSLFVCSIGNYTWVKHKQTNKEQTNKIKQTNKHTITHKQTNKNKQTNEQNKHKPNKNCFCCSGWFFNVSVEDPHGRWEARPEH